MKNLETEVKKDVVLYRELFLNAEKTFKEIIKKLKPEKNCKDCDICHKIRYSQLSPAEINELAENSDSVSIDYIKLYLPYGASGDFSYKRNNIISINANNEAARIINPEYVDLIKNRTGKPVYFYFCKDSVMKNCICIDKNSACCEFPVSVTTILPEECIYREWQKTVLNMIKTEIAPDIYKKSREIVNFRENFKCARTGTCCRLACSEYSFEELKQKGLNGDNFAKQFSDIFIPYDSVDEAREIFPEYVDHVFDKLGENETIYFYRCPHISEDNVCRIYENRPQICRDFPENPLAILPKTCGYYKWKEEVSVATMTFHAMAQIYEFYVEKIEEAL